MLLHRPGQPDEPLARNLFPPIIGLAGIGLLACMVWALGLADRELGDELSRCSSVLPEQGRLACYDKLSSIRQPAKGATAPIHTPYREGLQ